MNRALLSLCFLLTAVSLAAAHPIPKNNHDRTIVVRLTPGAVVVEYRLEVDELTTVIDLPRSEWADLTDRRAIYPVYLRYFAPVLANNLVAGLDDRPLAFACVFSQVKEFEGHLRCDYRFAAKWAPEPGREHAFTFREGNFELDGVSALLVTVVGEGAVNVARADVPDVARLKKADDVEGLRKASAAFTVEPEAPLASFKGGLAPDSGPDRLGPPEGRPAGFLKPTARGETASVRAAPDDRALLGVSKPGPVPLGETGGPPLPAAADDPEGPPSRQRKVLDLLFNSRSGLAMALLAAAGLGAVHALTPGHGKTLVAAYLVGERGTVWHAVLLGIVTTLTHTAVVLALAAVALFLNPELMPALARVLGLVGGLMVAGLGLWLLTCRLSGRADHVHLGGGHGHGHGHGHDHDHGHSHGAPAPEGVGWRPLVWLGVSGGIFPCGEALVLLIAAISAGQPQLGLPLLLAFSAGLSGVLVAIGIGVVFAKRQVAARAGESERLRKLARALPLVSAVVVTALGLWLCFDSFHDLK